MLGTGTLRMIADCEDNNYSPPVWKTKGDKLELTLDGISHRIKNDGLNDGLSDGVNIIINDGVSDGVIDGVSDGVKNEIVSIIQLLANNEGINTDGIVKKLSNKSKPTIERYLKTGRLLNMIIYKGSAKTGGYYLTDKMRKYNK
jgi:ATP-dependent DNA helicase RecG